MHSTPQGITMTNPPPLLPHIPQGPSMISSQGGFYPAQQGVATVPTLQQQPYASAVIPPAGSATIPPMISTNLGNQQQYLQYNSQVCLVYELYRIVLTSK